MNLTNEMDPIRNWAKDKGIYLKGDLKTQTLKLIEEAGELSKSVLNNDKDEIIDYIRAAAKDDGMSQEEIDAMIEDPNDNSDYEKYQNDAREELESDFYDNYFQKWINPINVFVVWECVFHANCRLQIARSKRIRIFKA